MAQLQNKVGKNFGIILLQMAQDAIKDGRPNDAFKIYEESLMGISREYIMMILKNEAVVVVDDEGNVSMTDDADEIENNKEYMADWDYLFKKTLDDMVENNTKNINSRIKGQNFRRLQMCITDLEMNDYQSTYNNVVAHVLNAKDRTELDPLVLSKFDYFEDMFDEDAPSKDITKKEEQLYWTYRYIKAIDYLAEDFKKHTAFSDFLLKYQMVSPEILVKYEQKMRHICYTLNEFAEECHVNCKLLNIGERQEKVRNLLQHCDMTRQILRDKTIEYNMMDCYDAGWLSPNGKFFGGDGDVNSLIHECVAMDLFNGLLHDEMTADGVSEYGNSNNPQRWLEKHGWMKIHNDEVFGAFGKHRECVLNCPTETQIKMICEYADKFYDHKIMPIPRTSISNPDDWEKNMVSTYKLRQMDEFMLRDVFED